MNGLKEFKLLLRFIKEERFKLIIASTLIFTAGIANILNGYLNGKAVESITNMELKQSIIYLLIYFLIEITISGFIVHIAYSILYKIESSLTYKLGFATYKKALELPAVAYEKHSSGEIINRITNDTTVFSASFTRLLNIVSSLVGAAIIMVYVIFNSWIVALEIITIIIILFIIVKIYGNKIKNINKEKKEVEDKCISFVTETVRGIREVKTLGIKNNLTDDMNGLVHQGYDKSAREIDITKQFNMITRFLKTVLEVGVFITCVILLYYNQVSLAFFIAMTYYVYRYVWLIENINDLTQTYQKTVVSIGRVNEILENKLFEDEKFGNIELDNVKGIIEFKDVTFSYPDEDMTLNSFNLIIEPNKKIAVVGKSGQGKSTLFNLITRIFDVDSGEILLDGINIKELTERSLRDNISIIRQEPFIFNKTIKENFMIIDKNISLDKIREYCKLAYIDDYIMSLPNGYDTILGEGGVNLSGGQKQRLSIARTLSKQSKVILFDEATSALDNESQEYIKKAIDNLVKEHTVIIVAHRLSTIMDADIIHVVDKGRVVASGTHKELLENNKIYQKLYKTEL